MPLDAAPADPLRFSTDAIAPDERRDALWGLRERGLLPIEPMPDRVPRVRLAKWFTPEATLLAGSFDGVRQVSTPGDTADGALFVGINTRGTSRAVQGDREVIVGAGDAVVLGAEAGGLSLARPSEAGLLGLRVERRADAGCDLRIISRSDPALGLLTAYLHAVAGRGVLSAPALSAAILDHAVTLVDLALATAPTDALDVRHSVRAARLAAIRADVEANLGDAEALRVGALAARHGITPRYVHKLFETEGETYSEYVLRSRLRRAMRLLRDPGRRPRGISAIAFDCGFGDLSYFNRTFRRAFGATPSEVRRLPASTEVSFDCGPIGPEPKDSTGHALTPTPPSGWRNVPVMPRAASEARNT